MVSLAAICEGKTERLFCEQLLRPHLQPVGVDLSAIEIGVDCKQPGGNVSLDRVMHDVALLLPDYDYVTTLVDFFRLGSGWLSLSEDQCRKLASSEQANAVEKAAQEKALGCLGADAERFLPNVLMHEFEALLFTEPQAIVETTYARSSLVALQGVASQFASPEDINTGRATAPSKRLANLGANYGKIAHGVRIATKIGLGAIRGKCPHFDSWLSRLEALGV